MAGRRLVKDRTAPPPGRDSGPGAGHRVPPRHPPYRPTGCTLRTGDRRSRTGLRTPRGGRHAVHLGLSLHQSRGISTTGEQTNGPEVTRCLQEGVGHFRFPPGVAPKTRAPRHRSRRRPGDQSLVSWNQAVVHWPYVVFSECAKLPTEFRRRTRPNVRPAAHFAGTPSGRAGQEREDSPGNRAGTVFKSPSTE